MIKRCCLNRNSCCLNGIGWSGLDGIGWSWFDGIGWSWFNRRTTAFINKVNWRTTAFIDDTAQTLSSRIHHWYKRQQPISMIIALACIHTYHSGPLAHKPMSGRGGWRLKWNFKDNCFEHSYVLNKSSIECSMFVYNSFWKTIILCTSRQILSTTICAFPYLSILIPSLQSPGCSVQFICTLRIFNTWRVVVLNISFLYTCWLKSYSAVSLSKQDIRLWNCIFWKTLVRYSSIAWGDCLKSRYMLMFKRKSWLIASKFRVIFVGDIWCTEDAKKAFEYGVGHGLGMAMRNVNDGTNSIVLCKMQASQEHLWWISEIINIGSNISFYFKYIN